MAPKAQCQRCEQQCTTTAKYCSRCGTLRASSQSGIYVDSSSRPPGWYLDPFVRALYRYWNGQIWTNHIATDQGTYSSPSTDLLTFEVPEDVPETVPFHGSSKVLLAFSIGGLVASFALSLLFVVIDHLIGKPGGNLVLIMVSEAGLWTGFASTCILASNKFGTGSLKLDFGFEFRWRNAGFAIVGAFVGRFLTMIVGLVLVAIHTIETNPDRSLYNITTLSWLGWVVLAAISCVGAPIFEELFFRGLLQTQLVQRLGPSIGILVTSIVFGAVHFTNSPGIPGLYLALEVGAGGLALGYVRYRTGRLGASMLSHATFNLTALLALAWLSHH